MKIESNLKKLQDNLRNAGWRIQHIAWQPEGKPEYIKPDDPISWIIVWIGLIGFLGGILLTYVSTGLGISIMLLGLFLLFISSFVMGFFSYKKYVPVYPQQTAHVRPLRVGTS